MESLAVAASLVFLAVIAPTALSVSFMIAGKDEVAAFFGACAAFLGVVWASLTPTGFPLIAMTNVAVGLLSFYRWRYG